MEQTNQGFYKPNGGDSITDDRLWKTNWDNLDDNLTQIKNNITGANGVYFPMYTPQQKGFINGMVENASPFIQEILDIAKTKGAVYCHIPAGTYNIGTRLKVYRNTKIILDEGVVFVRKHPSGYFVNGDSGENFSGYTGHGNILIDGGVYEGNLTEFDYRYNAFGIARGENITFRNMTIKDVRGAHAIDLNACKNVLIERCSFLGYDPNWDKGDNGSYFREAIQIAEHTDLGFGYVGEFDGTPCTNVTVRNCYFGASDNQPAYPTAIGQHGSYYEKYNNNIHIYNNVFDGMTYAGVRPFKYKDVFIHHNEFYGCNRGVQMSNPDGTGTYDGGVPASCENIFISENIFTDTKEENVYCVGWLKDSVIGWAKNLRVVNNLFINQLGINSKTNIFLVFVDDLLISGNVSEKTYRDIWVKQGRNLRINNNESYDSVNEFVYCNEDVSGYAFNHVISHNKVDRCGRTGINVALEVDGFDISFNDLHGTSYETDGTRSSIAVSTGAKNGKVTNNKVRKATSGFQNSYGVEITGSCANIQTFNNDSEGKMGRLLNNSSGGFDGHYVHSPNGTRYRVTIDDLGQLVYSAG